MMHSVLIDQTVFAEKIGASRSTFGRLVGSGVVPGHGKKNKIIESEAIVCLVKAGRLDDKGMFITKKSPNQKRMKIEDAPHFSFTGEIKTTVLDDDKVASLKASTLIVEKERRDEREKACLDIENASIVEELGADRIFDTVDMPSDLASLLFELDDPSKRVQIIKDYWTGKIQNQKFLKEKGELIPLNEAKAVIEMIYHPFSKKLDNFHVDIKARFPDIQIEAIEWVQNEINDMKKSVQEYAWEF